MDVEDWGSQRKMRFLPPCLPLKYWTSTTAQAGEFDWVVLMLLLVLESQKFLAGEFCFATQSHNPFLTPKPGSWFLQVRVARAVGFLHPSGPGHACCLLTRAQKILDTFLDTAEQGVGNALISLAFPCADVWGTRPCGCGGLCSRDLGGGLFQSCVPRTY